MLRDKRQEGLTVSYHIDSRVHCPTEMHIWLHLLPDKRFWVVTKFVDSLIYQGWIRCITFTLIRHIDQR